MRPDAALADRRRAVRESAEGWRDTGAIDEAGYRAVVAAYPDDRVRLGLGFRVLVGLAAFVGGGAFCGLLAVLFQPNHAITMFALGLAVVFTVATELQVGHFRRNARRSR